MHPKLFLVVSLSCLSTLSAAPVPTWSREVSRIVQKNCEACHRPGQIAPFALTSYDEASAFAPEIKRGVQSRRMPPWKAVKGIGPEFRNERRLSDEEVAILSRWTDAGAPRGDPKDLPAPIKYPEGWRFGPPDFVVQPEVTYGLDRSGVDEYRCFVVPTNFAEDRTIQGFEVRPGNRSVVHHVLTYVDVSGRARELDAKDPKPGFNCFGGLGFLPQTNLGGWAPGDVPSMLPATMGRSLPRGADLVMQVHYHKNGKLESDRSSVALYFNKEPVKQFVRLVPVLNMRIRIPAGTENHIETSTWTFPHDGLALSVFPHMHLLGKSMHMVAVFPDGRKQDLVKVNWDFNWQTGYVFKDPIPMPKGTRIDVTAVYDNSDKNEANPNKPLREVRWGDATTDEMLIGWIAYAIDRPAAAAPSGGGK